MSISLTPQQSALLAYLRSSHAQSGEMPSFNEMMAHMGLRSKSGVHRLLTALEERGHITRMPHRRRAICLTGGGVSRADALVAVLARDDLPPLVEDCLRRLLAAEGEAG